jgi:hypothetical protein
VGRHACRPIGPPRDLHGRESTRWPAQAGTDIDNPPTLEAAQEATGSPQVARPLGRASKGQGSADGQPERGTGAAGTATGRVHHPGPGTPWGIPDPAPVLVIRSVPANFVFFSSHSADTENRQSTLYAGSPAVARPDAMGSRGRTSDPVPTLRPESWTTGMSPKRA